MHHVDVALLAAKLEKFLEDEVSFIMSILIQDRKLFSYFLYRLKVPTKRLEVLIHRALSLCGESITKSLNSKTRKPVLVPIAVL